MYAVEYSVRAVKALKKMDRQTTVMLISWVEKNLVGCSDPRAHGKALSGDRKGYWRYRIGSYRLIAKIDDNIITINIINAGHRRDIYKMRYNGPPPPT